LRSREALDSIGFPDRATLRGGCAEFADESLFEGDREAHPGRELRSDRISLGDLWADLPSRASEPAAAYADRAW
jgi:hypothetical protein